MSFLFSLSFTVYAVYIAFLCQNDLPVQISEHLIFNPDPDFFFRSLACSFLVGLDCSCFISYSIFLYWYFVASLV